MRCACACNLRTWTCADLAPASRLRTDERRPAPGRAAELPFGHWDQGRIQQVFHNLVANAVKYSPSDSEIRLSVEDLRDRVRVSVVDQGRDRCGCAAARLRPLLPRIWAGRIRGLGLGLHIAKTCRSARRDHHRRIRGRRWQRLSRHTALRARPGGTRSASELGGRALRRSSARSIPELTPDPASSTAFASRPSTSAPEPDPGRG